MSLFPLIFNVDDPNQGGLLVSFNSNAPALATNLIREDKVLPVWLWPVEASTTAGVLWDTDHVSGDQYQLSIGLVDDEPVAECTPSVQQADGYGVTGTLDLDTNELADAFDDTDEDELTFWLSVRRTRASGEVRTILRVQVILKRPIVSGDAPGHSELVNDDGDILINEDGDRLVA